MDRIKDSSGVHVWNKLSKNSRVTTGSKQPYSLVASRVCPRTYSLAGDHFWPHS